MSRLPRLLQQDIDERMRELTGWQQQGDTLTREYTLPNFAAAVGFVNAVAILAEKADHHPDISLYSWNRVRLVLSTHDSAGLTERDFQLAAHIDSVLP